MISKIKEGLKGRYSSDYNQFKWKGEFLSESTCAFHRKLMLVTEPFSIQVLTKTALTDLFYVKGNKVDELNHQYLDFLLCDEKSMTPLLAINIDNKKKQGIVDDLFESAGIKLVHVEPKSEYDVIELISLIESNIGIKYLLKGSV